VLTDRYVDSSLAYQGAGRELRRDDVARLSRWATEGLSPTSSSCSTSTRCSGLRRAGDSPDRIEAESLEFHRRVREGFLELAGRTPAATSSSPPTPRRAGARGRARPAGGAGARAAGRARVSVFADLVGQEAVVAQLRAAAAGPGAAAPASPRAAAG
jgi:hypothetical protein